MKWADGTRRKLQISGDYQFLRTRFRNLKTQRVLIIMIRRGTVSSPRGALPHLPDCDLWLPAWWQRLVEIALAVHAAAAAKRAWLHAVRCLAQHIRFRLRST